MLSKSGADEINGFLIWSLGVWDELGGLRAELADAVGTSPATVSRWATGEAVPERHHQLAILDAIIARTHTVITELTFSSGAIPQDPDQPPAANDDPAIAAFRQALLSELLLAAGRIIDQLKFEADSYYSQLVHPPA